MTGITRAIAAQRARLEKGENEKGFTLIELLVVVIIIGILAAIAIPIFLAQQDQAKDSAAKSDLGQAKISYVSYLVETPSGVATDAATTLTPYGFQKSSDTTSVTVATGGSAFCIEAVSGSSGATEYHVTNTGGVQNGLCP